MPEGRGVEKRKRFLAQAKPDQEEANQERYSNQPPKPMDTARDGFLAAEFTLDKILVIEFFVGQIQTRRVRLFGPAGLFIGATLRTGLRVARNFGAAIGTDFWRHRFWIPEVQGAGEIVNKTTARSSFKRTLAGCKVAPLQS